MADSAVLRRSLTKGQKLAIVLEMDGLIKGIREKAKENQQKAAEITNAKLGRGSTDDTLMPNWSKPLKTNTRKEIAEKAGVGSGSVQRLTEVQRDAPDLFEKVKAGEMSINKAYTTKKKRENGGECGESGNKYRNHKQQLDTIAKEVKHREELAPKENEDESEHSLNNRLIATRKIMFNLTTNVLFDFDLLKKSSREVKKYYIQQAKSLAEALVISVGGYTDNKEYEEICFVVLELLKKVDLGEELFNENK